MIQKKIGIILILIVLTPALFYTAYEINTLDENELIVTQIFEQQLDYILTSVNQEVYNVFKNWADKINYYLTSDSKNLNANLMQLIQYNSTIDGIFLADTSGQIQQYIFNPKYPRDNLPNSSDLSGLIGSNYKVIKSLVRKSKTGYLKLERLTLTIGDNKQILVFLFIASTPMAEKKIAGMIINSTDFVSQVFTPKIMQINSETLRIGLFETATDKRVNTETEFPEGEVHDKRKLWLFPEYYIAIRLEGQSIEELAQRRFYRSLVLIFFIDFIILIGVGIIYRNIRTEMRLTQMKSDFVSNVSHELRTPLSLIRMFAETLELNRVQTENKKREYYQIIGQESERLTHLINNILDFSKIEAGKKHYHMEVVDLNEIVKDVIRLYSFHLQNKGFHLQNEIISDEKLMINADKDAITEAIINLIDNAMKYSDQDKRIRIKSGVFQDTVFFEIEDHGIGIGIEDQQKVFDKFYRVSTGLVHDVKGTGLGLSLIKYIMEMHNGRVSVESHLGKGSTFRIIFPKEH